MVPKLLVSVRNAEEAEAAVAGGCDILDIKEPSRGSLGRADKATILDILNALGPDAPPVSAALGELRDFHDSPMTASIPPGLAYVKLGLAGCATFPHWQNRWIDIQTILAGQSVNPPQWASVIYADTDLAKAPSVRQIYGATNYHSKITLVDTFRKDGRSLTDVMTPTELRGLQRGLGRAPWGDRQLALAGSLTLESLPKLADVPCDILAIRTAACRNGDRNGPICPDAIRRFKDAIHTVFS